MTSYATSKITIVVKSEDRDALKTLKERLGEGYNIAVSDSLFCKYDNSERSKLYVINELSQVVYDVLLKEASKKEIDKLLVSQSEERINNLNVGKIRKIETSKNFVYLFNLDNSEIFRISKRNLAAVDDTISITSSRLKEDLFKSQYGILAQKRMTDNDHLCKMNDVDMKLDVIDARVYQDTLILLVSYPQVRAMGKDVAVLATQSILKYWNKSYISGLKVNYNNFLTTKSGQSYTLRGAFFGYYDGTYVMPVYTRPLNPLTSMICKLKISDEELYASKLLPFYMPEIFVKSDIGFLLGGKNFDNNFYGNTYYSDIFDCRTEKVIHFGLSEGLSYTKKEVENLTAKISFQLIDFNVGRSSCNYAYFKDGSVNINRYNISNGSVKLVGSMLLSSESQHLMKYFALSCETEGFYNYDPEAKTLNFTKYNFEVKNN